MHLYAQCTYYTDKMSFYVSVESLNDMYENIHVIYAVHI